MTGTFAMPEKSNQSLGGHPLLRKSEASKSSSNILAGTKPSKLLADIVQEENSKAAADTTTAGTKNRMTYMSRLGISSKGIY